VSEPLITVSGLRGIVGESLTPEVAVRYACSFATEAPEGAIIITRDGRATGEMLAEAIRVGLAAVGRDSIDAGVAATPTTGVLVRHSRAAGGIQITASHNPPEYNGLKLFAADGGVLSAAAGRKVLQRYRDGTAIAVLCDAPGLSRSLADTTNEHLGLVAAAVEVERIRRRRFRVLLDANHGSGSVLGRRLLEEFGCTVTVLGGEPDGRFAHPPEPTAENLAGVLRKVTECGAEIGFCQDPDADRLAIVDERGRYLGEEYTLAMCVDHVLRRRRGPIVTNCSTSRMSQDLAERYEVPFFRSAVGEANVVEVMRAKGAILGGEGNGGVIDSRVGFVRDSFIGMALVLEAMAERGMSVGALADELPRYEIVKTRFTLGPERVAKALDALEKYFCDATADRLDGLRLDWHDKWLLVRASNTEPIIRAIAEAPIKSEAERLCAEAAEVVHGR